MASKLIDLLNKRRCRTWRPLAAHTEPADGHVLVGHEAFAGACDYGTDDDSSVDETPAECTCFKMKMRSRTSETQGCVAMPGFVTGFCTPSHGRRMTA